MSRTPAHDALLNQYAEAFAEILKYNPKNPALNKALSALASTPKEALNKALNAEREEIIRILSNVEFSSLEHMPYEAAVIIRARSEK